jgi:hypothetical protein
MNNRTVNNLSIQEISDTQTSIEISPALARLGEDTNPYGYAYLSTLGRLGVHMKPFSDCASTTLLLEGSTEDVLARFSRFSPDRVAALASASAELAPHPFQQESYRNFIGSLLGKLGDEGLANLPATTPFYATASYLTVPFAREVAHPGRPLHVWIANARRMRTQNPETSVRGYVVRTPELAGGKV